MTADYGRLPTEREILRALWGTREELVRSEIHRRLPHSHRPTLGRVGQILAALHEDGLLVRVKKRAQGSPTAGFYVLSDTGRELCRDLGFKRAEELLFDAPEEMLRANLTQKRLSELPSSPARIITAYSLRGGIGQTTLAAHVTRGLAEQLSGGQAVLAVDLDLEAPGLDALAPRGNLEQCRGLGGLVLDFERRPPTKRALWLRGALNDPSYVVKASDDLPNLFYLPNGLSSSQTGLSSSERAEAMALLRTEAALTRRSAPDTSEHRSPSFFLALHEALLSTFVRTVIDSQTKNSLGAWIATQCLADQLALCIDSKDTSRATLAGLRSVLANFLGRYEEAETAGSVLFLFRSSEPRTRQDLARWIDDNILVVRPEIPGTPDYPVDHLPYNVRLEGPYDSRNTYFYKHIVANLGRGATASNQLQPPELTMLLTALDPSASPNIRSIAAGSLSKIPLHGFVRLIQWYEGEGILPIETDVNGETLLRGVIDTLLISKIIKSSGRRASGGSAR